jgi:hypothetical protein
MLACCSLFCLLHVGNQIFPRLDRIMISRYPILMPKVLASTWQNNLAGNWQHCSGESVVLVPAVWRPADGQHSPYAAAPTLPRLRADPECRPATPSGDKSQVIHFLLWRLCRGSALMYNKCKNVKARGISLLF